MNPADKSLLVVLGFVGFLVLFLFRARLGVWFRRWRDNSLGPRMSRLVRGISPSQVIWQNADGTYSGKCKACKSPVNFSQRVPGELAYHCEACGETLTWV